MNFKHWPFMGGVLAHIGLCYFFAVPFVIHLQWRTRAAAVSGFLILYWLAAILVPVPGYGAGVFTEEGSLASWIDGQFISGHLWNEGPASTPSGVCIMLLVMLAGWMNRHQQDVIEYLKEENKILREKLGTKRILLSDNQRMRLARLARRLGRAVLADACGVFSPDTLLKWHRTLVARKYDGSKKRTGGKKISEELEQLIIQIARKNKTWGSRRIKGQLKYLGHKVSHTTIDNVLKRNGYSHGPDRARQTRWSEFLRSHWESLAAIDFFTTEIYTLTGLTRASATRSSSGLHRARARSSAGSGSAGS